MATALTRLVTDPDQVRTLHKILGPFCHESRNLLNSLKMSLYLAQRHEERSRAEIWCEVEQDYHEIERLYDRLQMIFRPLPLSVVRMPLSLLLDDRRKSWAECFAARGRNLELIAGRAQEVGDYDPHHLGQALDAFVSWRAAAGEDGQPACLRWWTAHGAFRLAWNESGSESAMPSSAGIGASGQLALPLLVRVIAAHGGSIELGRPLGRHLRLSWPQVARLPH